MHIPTLTPASLLQISAKALRATLASPPQAVVIFCVMPLVLQTFSIFQGSLTVLHLSLAPCNANSYWHSRPSNSGSGYVFGIVTYLIVANMQAGGDARASSATAAKARKKAVLENILTVVSNVSRDLVFGKRCVGTRRSSGSEVQGKGEAEN